MSEEAIRFSAQVFKVSTLIDGGLRLTLDLCMPFEDKAILALLEARKPGVILECAAVAIKAAKQAGVAVRKSSRHATSDYGAADAAGEQAGDAVGIPTEAEFAAAGEASAACFATNYWYLGKRRAWFSRGGPNGRTSRMAQVAPRDLLILYEVLQVLRIGGIFCCRAPLDSFFFFFF